MMQTVHCIFKMPPVANPKVFGCAFTLTNGSVEYADDAVMASVLRDTCDGMIVAEKEFPSLGEFDDFKRVQQITTPKKSRKKTKPRAAAPVASKADDDDEELDEEQKKHFEDMKAAMDDKRPSSRIEFHVKTSVVSPVAVVVVRFKGEDGKDVWSMKPASLLSAAMSYYDKIKAESADVQAFVMSMDLCDQRDLSGPPSKVLVNNWQSPTTSKRMAFPYNLLVGRLLLPYEKLGSYDAEADYVQKVLTEVGNSFKDVMAKKMFGLCYKYSVNNDAIWAAIGDPNKTRNYYRDFVQAAKVKVVKCTRLVNHVVEDDAARLLDEIMALKVQGLKCPGQKVSGKRSPRAVHHVQPRLTRYFPSLPLRLRSHGPPTWTTPMGLTRTIRTPRVRAREERLLRRMRTLRARKEARRRRMARARREAPRKGPTETTASSAPNATGSPPARSPETDP